MIVCIDTHSPSPLVCVVCRRPEKRRRRWRSATGSQPRREHADCCFLGVSTQTAALPSWVSCPAISMSASLSLTLSIVLDEIFAHLQYHQGPLARLCLVSRDFAAAARPVLYSWLRLREVDKCARILTTLASSEDLCSLLRHRASPLHDTR